MKHSFFKLVFASVFCFQTIAPLPAFSAMPAAPQLPMEAMHRLYYAIDAGNIAEVRSIVDTVRMTLISDPSQANYLLDLNVRDQAGNTPLIRAAMQKNIDIVRYFVQLGVDINAYNQAWETALIVSYNTGNYESARYLLSQGASDTYDVASRLRAIDQHNLAEREAKRTTANRGQWKLAASLGAGAAVIGGIAAAVGGGGGGSSGGGSVSGPIVGGLTIDCGAGAGIHPEACNQSSFNTTEAQNQEGVLEQRANYAYARGYDGRIFARASGGALLDDQPDGNVVVAVIDTGVDSTHPDLDSNMLAGVTCTTNGCAAGNADIDGHGTNVAGVLAAERNDIGMQGIAPEARVLPIAAISVMNGSTIAAMQYANAQSVQVVNNSWGRTDIDGFAIPIVDANGPSVTGHASTNYTALTPAQLRTLLTTTQNGTTFEQEFQAAIAAHRIIVFAAGNSALDQVGLMGGLPLYFQGATAPGVLSQMNYDTVNPSHYDWSENWVVSVALNQAGTIAAYSHECGVARDWCLAAPGDITMSTENGGGYSSGTIYGTSFAAPNVSGAIAIMLGAFPQLDPEEALAILFDTATDLGAMGVDDVYGRGMLDLDAATDPTVGNWTLSLPNAVMGIGFEKSGFNLSSPFGNALAKNHAYLIFQDRYNKDYTIPMSILTHSLGQQKTSLDTFNSFARNDVASTTQLGEYGTLGFTPAGSDRNADRELDDKFANLSYHYAIPMGALGENSLSFGFNYGTDPSHLLNNPDEKNLLVSRAYSNPYVSMTDRANSAVMGYATGHSAFSMGTYSAKLDDEYQYHFHGKKRLDGFFSEYQYGNARNQLGMSSGVMVEQNSLLGSETSGAFGIDQSTTYHTGFSGRYELADNVSLLANYHMGLTNVSAASASLFTGFDNIMTSAFATGLEFGNVGNDNDRLSFVLSQPLRVASGGANMALPVDVLRGGSVLFENQRLNLAPSARELDIESYYNVQFTPNSELSLNAILRMAPGNDNSLDPEAAFIGKYSLTY